MKKRILTGAILAALCVQSQGQNNMHYFMQTPDSPASSTPYGDNAAVGHYVQADDARIYYEVYGKGEPVLVLHGGGVGSMYEMGQFIDSLSTKYQVIAVATRGHGKSEIGYKPITHEQRANDAYAALTTVTHKPAIVLGFSDGAYTGYKLAVMHPDKVKKLIAIGAGENITPALRQILPNKVDDFMMTEPLFMKTMLRLSPQPERIQEYWNDLARFYNTLMVSKELLGSIQCPVLVMSGELDMNAPLATIIAAYQMIPNAQLAIIPNAPHSAFIANFPATWAMIKPFLQIKTNK